MAYGTSYGTPTTTTMPPWQAPMPWQTPSSGGSSGTYGPAVPIPGQYQASTSPINLKGPFAGVPIGQENLFTPATAPGIDLGGLFDAIMQQSAASIGAGGGGAGGIDPSLINSEFDIRRAIANMGIQQNNLSFQGATMDYGRLKSQHDLNAALLGNQVRDVRFQKQQNILGQEGTKARIRGVGESQEQARLGAAKQRFDINSQATAAGAYGSAGRKFNLGNLQNTLASQLAGLQRQIDVYNTELGQADIGLQRSDLELANAMYQSQHNENQLAYGYGDLLIAGGGRDLANQLVGQNVNLLNNQQQQQLANNANAAANASAGQGMGAVNAQQNAFNQLIQTAGALAPGMDPNALVQALTRAIQGG